MPLERPFIAFVAQQPLAEPELAPDYGQAYRLFRAQVFRPGVPVGPALRIAVIDVGLPPEPHRLERVATAVDPVAKRSNVDGWLRPTRRSEGCAQRLLLRVGQPVVHNRVHVDAPMGLDLGSQILVKGDFQLDNTRW